MSCFYQVNKGGKTVTENSVNKQKLPFKEGDFIDWRHGDNYRSGTILKIEGEWVEFSGITKTYRIKLKTLLKNYGRVQATGANALRW